MIKQFITLMVIIQTTLLSSGQENTSMNIKGIELFQKRIDYPYQASEIRKSVILENMNKLEKGMSKDQVVELMTHPDEANLTFKFKKAKSEEDNVIGFSLVYILRRDAAKGSGIEKNEQLLRIHFDNSGELIWNDSIDIDGFKAIKE